MAEIFLATVGDIENPPAESLVVIKISRAQDEHQEFYQDTIQNEAIRLRTMQHDGIVRILPLQTDNEMRQAAYEGRASALPGTPWFLVLEYLEGGSLRELLAIHKQLDVKFALEVVRRLAETLDHVHRLNQVHLDIKPENILFRHKLGGGAPVQPVLIDFGIARHVGQTGLEASTLVYAPPERVQLNRVAPESLPRPTPSMDVYSLGVVLYQMVTGRRPFDGRGTKHISTAILSGNPTTPSTYGKLIFPDLDELILRLLHKTPQQRPTAGELAHELDQMLRTIYSGERRVNGPMTTSAISAVPSRRRRGSFGMVPMRMGAIVLACLFVLLIGGQTLAWFTTGALWLPAVMNTQQLPQQFAGLLQGLFVGAEAPASATAQPTAPPTAPASDVQTNPITPAVAVKPTDTPRRQATTAPPKVIEKTPLPIPSATATKQAQAPSTSTPVPERPRATSVILPTAVTPSLSKTTTPRRPPPSTRAGGTSTAVPEFTVMPTPSNTPTRINPTATNTAVAVVNVPATRPSSPPNTNQAASLVAPENYASGRGRVLFQWTANFTLGPNQAFEPIFWREGQDPFVSGLGWGGTTTDNSKEVNFENVAPDTYLWGVLLVETAPYNRVKLLSESRHYAVQGSASASSR